MVSVNHIYCRQIVRFHCVCLSHRGCLIWVKFVKIPKQKFESQLAVVNRSLFSDKARCFSQSECALYGNFIIKLNKISLDRVYDYIYNMYNHKNYNFLDCDWFKNTPIFH